MIGFAWDCWERMASMQTSVAGTRSLPRLLQRKGPGRRGTPRWRYACSVDAPARRPAEEPLKLSRYGSTTSSTVSVSSPTAAASADHGPRRRTCRSACGGSRGRAGRALLVDLEDLEAGYGDGTWIRPSWRTSAKSRTRREEAVGDPRRAARPPGDLRRGLAGRSERRGSPRIGRRSWPGPPRGSNRGAARTRTAHGAAASSVRGPWRRRA